MRFTGAQCEYIISCTVSLDKFKTLLWNINSCICSQTLIFKHSRTQCWQLMQLMLNEHMKAIKHILLKQHMCTDICVCSRRCFLNSNHRLNQWEHSASRYTTQLCSNFHRAVWNSSEELRVSKHVRLNYKYEIISSESRAFLWMQWSFCLEIFHLRAACWCLTQESETSETSGLSPSWSCWRRKSQTLLPPHNEVFMCYLFPKCICWINDDVSLQLWGPFIRASQVNSSNQSILNFPVWAALWAEPRCTEGLHITVTTEDVIGSGEHTVTHLCNLTSWMKCGRSQRSSASCWSFFSSKLPRHHGDLLWPSGDRSQIPDVWIWDNSLNKIWAGWNERISHS